MKNLIIAPIYIMIDCVLWWIVSNLDGELKELRGDYVFDQAELIGKQVLFIIVFIIFVFFVSATIKTMINIFKNENRELLKIKNKIDDLIN